MKITVVWDMIPCGVVESTNVCEKPVPPSSEGKRNLNSTVVETSNFTSSISYGRQRFFILLLLHLTEIA